MVRGVMRVLSAAGLAMVAANAEATWSILIVDTGTGEIALGSATCLTGFDLRENTPVVVAGVGAATAQSFVDSGTRNRSRFLKGLIRGDTLDEILQTLSVEDSGHQTRQYGFVSAAGEALTFTGTQAGRWAGGLTGVLPGAGPTGGDLYYAVQGNVLTGEPVVLRAEEAIIATSGPLSDRLMAAMEAARDQGGDGRCSCDTSPADSCGAPPMMFEKSADIGYAIVARPGDPDACRPFYPQDQIFTSVAAQRSNAGGSVRLAGGSTSGQVLRVWDILRSGTGSTSVAVETAIDLPGGASIPFVGFADLDGDGTEDLVAIVDGEIVAYAADSATGAILGTSGPTRTFADVSRGAIGDFDGDGAPDLAGVSGDGVWVSWNDGGAFSPPVLVAIDGTAIDLDVIPGASDSLVVINSDDAMISVIDGAGSRSLAITQTIAGEGAPRAIASGDLDGDGTLEFAYIGTDNQLRFASLDGSPAPAPVTTLAFGYDLRIADFKGDDGVNEVLVVTPASLALVEQDGQGVFSSETLFTGPSFGSDLADLDGDGRRDFVGVTSGNARSLYIISGTEQGFDARIGCGNGNYHFSLNVANQQRADPDPVDQLRLLYDAQRASLAGVTDAIASEVFLTSATVSPGGLCDAELIVSLADLDGAPVAGLDASAVRVELLDGAVELGDIEEIAPSVYAVPVVGTGEVGTGSVRVFVDDPNARRAVRLSPDISFEIRDLADIDGDGVVAPSDFQAWLDAFNAGEPRADVDRNGRINGQDFGAWLGAFNDPCR